MIRSAVSAVVAAGWSLAFASCVCCPAGVFAQDPTAQGGAPVLYLHTEFLPYPQYKPEDLPYRLGREIMRQAVLLAARDEMGLATRDETLQEPVPEKARVVHLLATERANMSGKWDVKLMRQPGGEVLWEKSFDFIVHGGKIYGDIIPKLEVDTRGAFLEGLRAAGLQGAKPAVRNPSPPGPEIEKLLGKVDIVAQFGAVRAAHEAIASQGETPAWLGVLVRGYSNLALLTNHYWNSTPEVYTARAWLYAQRMVAADPNSDLALWHRAYAWALGGTLQHALTDLAELEQRQQKAMQSGAAAGTPSSWAKLITAYCKCDREGLAQVGRESAADWPWATMLEFMLVRCDGESHAMFDVAQRVTDVCPTAYCVYGDLVRYGSGLALSRSGAAWAPEMFSRHVPRSLSTLAGLPFSVQSLVAGNLGPSDQVGDERVEFDELGPFSRIPAEAARRLRAESSGTVQGEPSWSALASLLEEEQFVQIVDYFLDDMNAMQHSLADDVDRLLPLIKNHRYAAFVNALRYYPTQGDARLVQLFGSIKLVDPRMNMVVMLRPMWNIPDSTGQGMGAVAHSHAHRNFTLQGMLEYIAGYTTVIEAPEGAAANMFCDEVHEVAPQSDKSVALRMLWTKSPTAEQLKGWEDQLKENPLALSTLAYLYNDAGNVEGAIRCAERSIAASPTSDATVLLADLYLRQGKLDKWEQVLLDFLKTPDLGLEHGPTLITLAHGYAGRGQWQKAKAYAEQYAQTGAQAGLRLGAYVCEGLAEWEESEGYIRMESLGYPSSGAYRWYFWCRRTGRGDVKAATELAQQHAAVFDRQTRETAIHEGMYHLLNGDADSALEAYRAAFAFVPSFTCTFMIAQLARSSGDERLRSEVMSAMQKSCIESPKESPEEKKADALGLAILQFLKSGDASAARLEKIDQLMADVAPQVRSAYSYYIGKELVILGKQEEAEKYWRRSLVTPNWDLQSATLSGFELAKRHGTSRPDDDVLDEGDLWPAPQK